ncbi:MAG TPA: SDR family oxidoreductase [Acidimicrobiales bacterium]|nr:SDR family oxidoreductase [Acidimicrobiales bacterium]
MRFAGRTAVVTGAGSGIGFEMARLLLEEGATVIAADLDPASVPDGAVGVKADVSQVPDVEAMIRTALDQTGRLDVLLNNAGIGSTADPVSCTVEDWDRVFSVNVRGVFLGTKFALPAMLEAGRGAIVNTASVAGMVGLPNRTSYCASKGAVIAFTRQVAVQYASTGVRCNCVCPGTVDSPWVGRLMDETEDPAATRAALTARQPMGRLGQPVEIAKAALYLASDDAGFVTGEALVIDGGLTAA